MDCKNTVRVHFIHCMHNDCLLRRIRGGQRSGYNTKSRDTVRPLLEQRIPMHGLGICCSSYCGHSKMTVCLRVQCPIN